MNPGETIFFVGFMGVGKSSIAAALARELQRPCIDLDEIITINSGLAIKDIFAHYGEDYFRQLESQTLHQLNFHSATVVALGGGTFLTAHNRDFIHERGISIWLECALPAIISRLANDTTRPLYQADRLAALLERRLAAYQRADLRLDVTSLSIAEAVKELLVLLPSTAFTDNEHRRSRSSSRSNIE